MNNIKTLLISLIKEQFYTVSVYARSIVGTLVVLIIARYLSVYDFGLFSSYKSIAVFILLFANLEFDNYILVSAKNNPNKVKRKITLFLINAFTIIFITIIGTFIFKLESQLLFILVLCRTFLDSTFFNLILPYFQSNKKLNEIAKINIFYSITIALIAFVSYVLKLSLLNFLILNIIAGFINFLQCSLFTKLNYIFVYSHILRHLKLINKSIVAYISSSLTSYLYSQIPSLYVALFLIREKAALFFAAYTISQIANLFTVAQAQKILPELINAKTDKQQQILKKNIILVSVFIFLLIVFFAIFGKFILILIYKQSYYQDAQNILIILLLANLMIGLSTIWGTYMTAMKKQPKKVVFKIETSIITILSLYILKKYDINGICIALLLSSSYSAIRYGLYSINLLKNKTIKQEI